MGSVKSVNFCYILPMRKLTHDEIADRRTRRADITVTPRVPIEVLVDNVRSLYNVGSIFRSSDGAWIQKLFLCGFTPHPPRKEIEKTALGATDTVPWEYHRDPIEVVHELKRRGITLCVLEQTTHSIPFTDVSPEKFPLCLVIGNEISGVSRPLVEAADIAIEIPMAGTKQSLNVAVAYGIAVFELVRIYRGGGNPKVL